MYRFQTASKVLIWLLAALLPLQGLPGTACGCAVPAKPALDAHRASDQSSSCCCGQPASLPAEPPAAADSCCQPADSDVERTGGDCETGCECKKGDSSPRQKQIPSEHRTQATDLTASPLVIFCLECGDLEMMETEGCKAISLSGSDRCVWLCRFHL